MAERVWLRRGLTYVAVAVAALGIGVYMGRAQVKWSVGAKDSYQFFDTLVDVRSQILRNYVENVEDEKLRRGAIKGMMGELDQYSDFFSKAELEAFDKSVRGQFSGIGAEISQDPNTHQFIIVSPIEGSPALKAGVLAGDRIVKIDGVAVDGLALKDLIGKVGGDAGSQMVLTVIHEGEKVPVDLTITRAVIQIHSVKGFKHTEGADGQWDFLIDPARRIAYVRITNFMENTAEDLDRALRPLMEDEKSGGLKGIILDLRFNPGGLLTAGVEVADRFLESGVIVSTGKPSSPQRDYVKEAVKEGTYPRIPLVVLVNEYSASASEIVAGALKDHNRAVLVGTRSFGKGSVQTLITLDNGNAALKLTTQYYYLPNGKNIMRKKDAKEWGVEPEAAFNLPLTDAENKAILVARRSTEVIKKNGGGGTTTMPAGTQPAEDRQLQKGLESLVSYQVMEGKKEFPEAVKEVPATRKMTNEGG